MVISSYEKAITSLSVFPEHGRCNEHGGEIGMGGRRNLARPVSVNQHCSSPFGMETDVVESYVFVCPADVMLRPLSLEGVHLLLIECES